MSSPFPIFASQQPRSDGGYDANVVDSFDIETDEPPKPIIEPIPILAKPKRLFPTRLVTGYQRFGQSSTGEAMMILQPDVRRVEFKLWVTSLNATPDLNQYIVIAGDKQLTSLLATNNGGLVYVARQGRLLSLDDHTGAIWIAPNTPASLAVEGIEVTWLATSLQPDNGNDTEMQ